MAANRTVPAECAAALVGHSNPGLHRPAIANFSRARPTIAVQTNPDRLRRWHSTTRTQRQVQLLLASMIFLRLKRSVTRATRRFTLQRAGSHDFLCPLIMLTRLAVGLEALNALDAAHCSPQSAPRWRNRNWFPR